MDGKGNETGCKTTNNVETSKTGGDQFSRNPAAHPCWRTVKQ
jgi:hypothetical protein